MKTRLALLLLVISASAANADPVRFEWTNTGTTATLNSGSGYWIIDSSDLVPGFRNYKAEVTEFAFSWSTSLGEFSSSSALGNLVAQAFLSFGPNLEFLGFDVCVSTDGLCAARTGHPLLRTTSSLWGATRGPNNQTDFAFVGQTATIATAPVPEPGVLGLLGLGFLATALLRRRRR